MSRTKRLAVKSRKRIGWARRARHPVVTRPTDIQIEQKKKSTQNGRARNERRKIARDKHTNAVRVDEFSQQKGWTT